MLDIVYVAKSPLKSVSNVIFTLWNVVSDDVFISLDGIDRKTGAVRNPSRPKSVCVTGSF